MKIISTLLSFVFATFLYSCKKDQAIQAECSLQDPPTWCATVRCTPEGKPVCGCNNVTYGSICEAECAGVTSYTMGACK